MELLSKFYQREYKIVKENNEINFDAFINNEIKRYKLKKLSFPTLIGIKITNRCNFNCPFCFSSKKNPKDLSKKELLHIIKQLKIYKPHSIYITGGEPFLNSNIFYLLNELKKLNIKLSIHSNGSLIDEYIAKKLSKLLDKKDSIQISLDGYDNETFKITRNSDSFKKVINGINFLVKEKIYVKINTVVTNLNVNYLDKIYELSLDLGVNEISFSPLLNIKKSEKIYLPSDDLLLKNFSNVLKKFYSTEKKLIISQDPIAVPWGNEIIKNFNKNSNLVCPAGKTALEIDNYGNVFPCPYLYKTEFYTGNIFFENLLDIWNSKKWEIFRKLEWSNNNECKKCEFYNNCKAGCIAAAYINNRNYDPRCNKMKANNYYVEDN
jgi:radical SAM protein with 4Fe4S-binding SPASM domain